MSKLIHVSATALVLAATVAAFALFFRADIAKSAVITGSEYSFGTTTAAGSQVFKSTTQTPVCTLGSILIASSSATAFTVRNATSTTDVASTTIAVFEANAFEGTYTFDVACTRGVAIEAPTGFNGFVTTTFR